MRRYPSLYATTQLIGVPFSLGEANSEINPIPIKVDAVQFNSGEPISPSNPLPVTINPEAFKVGEPISIFNPLPVTLNLPSHLVGEPISISNRLYIQQAGSYELNITPTGELTTIAAAQWGVPYSATVAVAKPDGTTVNGLPAGLIGSVSGGILTVTGTPL